MNVYVAYKPEAVGSGAGVQAVAIAKSIDDAYTLVADKLGVEGEHMVINRLPTGCAGAQELRNPPLGEGVYTDARDLCELGFAVDPYTGNWIYAPGLAARQMAQT